MIIPSEPVLTRESRHYTVAGHLKDAVEILEHARYAANLHNWDKACALAAVASAHATIALAMDTALGDGPLWQT